MSRPERRIGDELVVSRPSDGSALLLNQMAALVWDQLRDWSDRATLRSWLAIAFPDVAEDDLDRALADTLHMLCDHGLLDDAPT